MKQHYWCSGKITRPIEPPTAEDTEIDDDWESLLPKAFFDYVKEAEKNSLTLAVLRNEKRIEALEASFGQIAERPFMASIATLTVQGLKLKQHIPILVKPNGDDYVVSFVDANIGATGETVPEAIESFKEIMAAMFRKLRSLQASALGPGPSGQLKILNDFIEAP